MFWLLKIVSLQPDFREISFLSVILRGGAVVARRAHNPKARGSNPLPATDGRPNHDLMDWVFSFL